MFGRAKIAMIVAEFMGTFALASTIFAMTGRTNFPFFAGAAAAVTLGVMVIIMGKASDVHLNPALTIALWTQRKIKSLNALVYIVAQMLGGLVAWQLNQYLLNQTLKNLAPKVVDWRVLTAEAVGTFVFTFGVAAAIYSHYEGLKRAFTIGASLFVGILIASFGSNGVLNPAVALGVRSWSVSYVAGPVLGALFGVGIYSLLLAPLSSSGLAPKKTSRKK